MRREGRSATARCGGETVWYETDGVPLNAVGEDVGDPFLDVGIELYGTISRAVEDLPLTGADADDVLDDDFGDSRETSRLDERSVNGGLFRGMARQPD